MENENKKNPAASNQSVAFGAVKTYVIRAGRMTDAQKRNYEFLSEKWCLPYEEKILDFKSVFGNDNPVTVEIGFGMGTVTAEIAKSNPEKNYLGLEVHKPGVGKLLGLVEENALSNVRIICHDALEVIRDMIADETVSAFHIFFPDPWPKARHHKRRIMQRVYSDLFTQKLKNGGYIYMVTDWEEYAEAALAVLENTPGLKNKYDNFAERENWRPTTKFEARGQKEGRKISELFFEKI